MKFGIGQSVPRTEDHRFLTGKGQFVDDCVHPHALHAAFVRSPLAHARILSVDTHEASEIEGVCSILTGTEYLADGLGGLSCHTVLPNMHQPIPLFTVHVTDQLQIFPDIHRSTFPGKQTMNTRQI